MYNVLDVCRFIINYCNNKNYGISNLKLQKLLYFVQAYFLTFTKSKTACFNEEIQAWDFGPVVPEAYHEYKQYGSSDIPPITSYLEINTDNIWESKIVNYDESIIQQQDRQSIEDVIDNFSDYSTTELVSITHNQSPWIDAYEKGKSNTITKEAIRNYFNG